MPRIAGPDGRREVQITFRITENEATVLSAIAALDSATANEIAYSCLAKELSAARDDELVQSFLALRERRAGAVTAKGAAA
jgi:hypothetical protein